MSHTGLYFTAADNRRLLADTHFQFQWG